LRPLTTISALALFFASVAAHAIDFPAWSFSLNSSFTTGNETTNVTATDYTTRASATTQANPGYGFGFEFGRNVFPDIELHLVGEWSKYVFKESLTPDQEFALFVMPRWDIVRRKHFEAWVAGGFGIVRTLTLSTFQSVDDIQVLSESEFMSLGFTGRAGFDVRVGKKLLLGAQGSYVTFSGNRGGSVANPDGTSANVNLTQDITRHWYSFGIRVGFFFDAHQ
jgi:hypothetical protein